MLGGWHSARATLLRCTVDLVQHSAFFSGNSRNLNFACSSPAGGMLFGVSGLLLLLLLILEITKSCHGRWMLHCF